MTKVRIGIVGSRFQADCIAGAVKAMPEEGEVVAVASPTEGHAAGLGRKVMLPFRPTGIAKPIDLWKTPERARTTP
jgi:hypothetical protein